MGTDFPLLEVQPMWLWKLFWFLQIHPIRLGRQGWQDRKWDMKDERDKRYKAKGASIWTFEKSQMWLSDIVFKLRLFDNKTIFSSLSNFKGLGLSLYWQCPAVMTKAILNPICAGEVKYKGSPNQWFADSRFLSTRYVNWNKVFLLSWEAWRGQNKSKYTYVCEVWPHGGEAWIGKICK